MPFLHTVPPKTFLKASEKQFRFAEKLEVPLRSMPVRIELAHKTANQNPVTREPAPLSTLRVQS